VGHGLLKSTFNDKISLLVVGVCL